MKVVLSKERVLNYIKKYYSEVLGINGYAVFESGEEWVENCKLDYKVMVPKIVYYGTTTILGQENKVTFTIHDLDIKNILDHFLAEEGYTSYNFYVDKGSHREIEDKYPVRRTKLVNRPYFNGVELEVVSKNNAKEFQQYK